LIQWGGYGVLFAIVFARRPADRPSFCRAIAAVHGRPPGRQGTLTFWVPQRPLDRGRSGRRSLATPSAGGWATGIHAQRKSLLFNPAHVERTRRFYEKYGAKTIVIAASADCAEFAPTVAASVRWSTAVRFYNVAGGVDDDDGRATPGTVVDIGIVHHLVVPIVIVLSL